MRCRGFFEEGVRIVIIIVARPDARTAFIVCKDLCLPATSIPCLFENILFHTVEQEPPSQRTSRGVAFPILCFLLIAARRDRVQEPRTPGPIRPRPSLHLRPDTAASNGLGTNILLYKQIGNNVVPLPWWESGRIALIGIGSS